MNATEQAKATIAKAQAQIDAARGEIESALVVLLKAAVEEIAAEFPGHKVSGVSAMGCWDITVSDVLFNEDYEIVDGPETDDCFKHVLTFTSTIKADGHYDLPHEALTAFDNAWDEYQVYPTIRFDVDKSGKLTSMTDWGALPTDEE